MIFKQPRAISWIKAAQKDFRAFPQSAQQKAARALTLISAGDAPESAKPLQSLGTGVWELAIKDFGDAYRVVYVLQLDDDIWVIHAFMKKSTSGIATPKRDIDLVRERLKRLKELL